MKLFQVVVVKVGFETFMVKIFAISLHLLPLLHLLLLQHLLLL
jgi:hypothetical protein